MLAANLVILMTIIVIGGCDTSRQSGIHVMFENNPHIVSDHVYWHGQIIGSITDIQNGNHAITKVTVRLEPEFSQHAGHHWAFYIDRGRLMPHRLSINGEAVSSGDHLCGFSSKAALNWFKVKTLLRDRVANAMRRADSLQRRFS